MFEIPKIKVLKAYNLASEACDNCNDKRCASCLLHKSKKNLLNYSKYEDRLDEKFKKESFRDYDQDEFTKFERDELEKIYDAVHDCCQECGVYHTEKCFLNNTREALQIMLYGKVKPWDGLDFKE
ncbi:hypothetical protein [Natroniella sp. ANB-PHB2]|uniref:hypothetical protein n=1 Tax=Natroniella sp. ANB-PHB2 TaxID=3384444 RepID=UPI0038D4A68C